MLTNGGYRRRNAPFTITAVNREVGWRADHAPSFCQMTPLLDSGRLSLANRIHWVRRPTEHSHPCIEALGPRARRVTNRIRSPR